MRYGKLLLLYEVGKNKRGEKLFECLCDCGTLKVVKFPNLKSGKTKSCGCIKTGPKPNNLSGSKKNRLTVIEYIGTTKWREQLLRCLCECGKIITLNSRAFLTGHTKSCGCLKKEIETNREGKNNPNYNPNLTDFDRKKHRSIFGLKNWKRQIKAKGMCEACNTKENLIAHHIDCWDQYPELRIESTNGACLCKRCHISFHRKYGFGFNNRLQYEEFLKGDK